MWIIKEYLKERHAGLSWTVVLMASTYVLLMVSTVLEANQLWFDSLPSPAYCLFQTSATNTTLSWSIFSVGGLPANTAAARAFHRHMLGFLPSSAKSKDPSQASFHSHHLSSSSPIHLGLCPAHPQRLPTCSVQLTRFPTPAEHIPHKTI